LEAQENFGSGQIFMCHRVLRVLRVFVVNWLSAISSPRRHGEHRECTNAISN